MEIELTKDAEYLLCALYKQYKECRKSGVSKSDARLTGSAQNIRDTVMPEWSFDDVDETCRELSRAGYLDCRFADNVTWNSSLTDRAIIYMENRFVNGISEVLGYMGKIKSALF